MPDLLSVAALAVVQASIPLLAHGRLHPSRTGTGPVTGVLRSLGGLTGPPNHGEVCRGTAPTLRGAWLG